MIDNAQMVTPRKSAQFGHHDVRTLYSVAHLFPKSVRCGVYILEFTNGERYVGQTRNVVTRFGTHRRRWDDIDSLDFCRCRVGDLHALERDVILSERSLGLPLRNIVHALGPLGVSDLDPVVSPDESYAWLNGDCELGDVQDRIEDSRQRQHMYAKFAALAKTPAASSIFELLNTYVLRTIPCPRETERTFWALSAMPSTGIGARLTTLCINKMETLFLYGETVGRTRGDGDIHGVINISAKGLEETRGIGQARRGWPSVHFETASYESAGGDGISVHGELPDLLQILEEEWFIYSARKLNLMLMRKGPTFQWRWHCFDLADWALRDDLIKDDWIAVQERGIGAVPPPPH